MAENKPLFEKKVLILVIVLFALVAALNIAICLSSLKKSSPVVVQPTEEPMVTPMPEPIITDIDVSDWMTYRNEKYGFEFKYPSTVILNSHDDYGNETVITNSVAGVEAQYNYKKGVFFIIENINIPFTPDGIKNQFRATSKENISIIPEQIASIDGYQVVFIDNKNIVSDFYFIKKGEQVFELTVLKNDKIASKMFFTFKFIE